MILLFRTGKMVCAGAKSEAGAAGAVRAFAGMPASRGIDADPEPDIRVRNMVATLDWKGAIRLEKAALSLPNTMYEPEMFPGLACRPPEPKCTTLLFASGKLVCAGARSEAETARGPGHKQRELAGLPHLHTLTSIRTAESAARHRPRQQASRYRAITNG